MFNEAQWRIGTRSCKTPWKDETVESKKGRSGKKAALWIISVLIVIGLAAAFFWLRATRTPESPGRGIFEWDEGASDDPERAVGIAKALELDRWYQEFDDYENAQPFVAHLKDAGIKVFSLIGATDWGFEEDGASFIDAMEDIVKYNIKNPDYPINGVMADIEPYTTSRFKDDPEGSMELYVSGMEKAYGYARSNKLTLITCIARHYDDQGLTDGLERLIQASDEVAVMDYDCGNEVAAIRTEAEFALKYGKILHTILEFQEVGKHGLTEGKTYRNKGLAAAEAAFRSVDQAYPDLNIVWDYHWTEPICQMLEEGSE